MRILITTPSGLGHVLPMVPLARAVRARGHDVLWATAPDTCRWVADAGFQTLAAGLDLGVRNPEFWRRHPEARALPPEQLPDVMFTKLFAEIAAPMMLAELLPSAHDWMPDLIVHDSAEFAAPIVAALVGAPNVAKSFGALTPRARVEAATVDVAPLWRSAGLDPRPFAGCYDHLYLDVYPPGMQPVVADHVEHRQLLRPVAYDAAEHSNVAVKLPDASAAQPLVYLTMGTVFNDPTVLREIVAAIAALDVRLLVTVGPEGDPAALGDWPPHVCVERYVPQTLVLEHCDVVVSHGGSGTVLATLSDGLPQLCLPQGADQFLNANAVAKAGAGLALAPTEASSDAIARAVARLLVERSFRNAAAGVAETIASMPSPDDVAATLEHLPIRS